jgi:hypothetical protein
MSNAEPEEWIAATWLKAEAGERLNSIPAAKLITQAVAEVGYKARKGFSYPIAARIYSDERSAVVHLGDGKMLDIRASGAGLNKDAGVVFPTPFNMEPLPDLEDAPALGVLPEILDLSDDQCRLVLIWLMALFQPNGRYPVLIINGPKQSGKTRVAGNIRRLLDPHPVAFLRVPSRLDELKAAVRDNAVVAFDDVEEVPDWLEETLLALGKGTAISTPGQLRPVLYKRPTIWSVKTCPTLLTCSKIRSSCASRRGRHSRSRTSTSGPCL